jgi:hypothetical protein
MIVTIIVAITKIVMKLKGQHRDFIDICKTGALKFQVIPK